MKLPVLLRLHSSWFGVTKGNLIDLVAGDCDISQSTSLKEGRYLIQTLKTKTSDAVGEKPTDYMLYKSRSLRCQIDCVVLHLAILPFLDIASSSYASHPTFLVGSPTN